MDKIWTSREKGDDRIIASGNGMLYKANPVADKIERYVKSMKSSSVPSDVLSIPLSCIKRMCYQENKKYIQVFFGISSEEHLRINSYDRLIEIFSWFKESLPHTTYRLERYSAGKSSRKPLIAVVITSLLFAWTLYYAIRIAMGYQYELIGLGNSIQGLVLAIASLGIYKVCLIFGTLLLIGILSVIHKRKNKPTVHEIVFMR